MKFRANILFAFVLVPAVVAAAGEVVLPTAVHSPQAVAFDAFGGDATLSSPTLCAVGVRGADGAAPNIGAVDTFDLKVDGWAFLERLQPGGLEAGDQFGEAVAANGSWLAVGAPRHDASGTDSGAVWVFERQALLWRNPQKLIPGMGSDGARFGAAVAVDAERIVIGAPGAAGGGAVSVFVRVGGSWQLEQTIANPSPADGDRFGDAVAIEGVRLLVGNPFEDAAATDRGSVFFYTLNRGNWQLQQTLVPQGAGARQYFGSALGLRNTRVAVGAYGTEAPDGTGSAGRVEVFDFVGGAWSWSAGLSAPVPVFGGYFGWDVALEAESLVVGEPGYGVSAGALTGRAHVYARQPSSEWILSATIETPVPSAQDAFGAAVAVASGRIVITAPGREERRGAMLSADFSRDCDQDGVSDTIQVAMDPSLDCNGDLIPDACQPDSDGDGIPNLCECRADLNGDGIVGSADLSFVLTEWGNYGQGPADINGDLRVDAQDITILLYSWGFCVD